MIGLGHSERKRVGELLATTLDKTGLFTRDIVVRTINQLESRRGTKKQNDLLADSTVLTHSAAIEYVDSALQVMAFNAPEAVGAKDLIRRGLVDIAKEKNVKEYGAHKTGNIDVMLAGAQLVTSPLTSYRTMSGIWSGYSASKTLAGAAEQFPAGRALIHCENDAFLFPKLADMELAARSGVSTALIPERGHNQILFAPGLILSSVMPHILPQCELIFE